MLLSLINNVTAIRKRKPAQGKCKITPFNLLCIQTIPCSKSVMETLEKGLEYVQP